MRVMTVGTSSWRNYIHFRDRLLGDVSVRRSYAKLKSDLVKRYPGDRQAYTAAKGDFIQGVLTGRDQA